MGEEEPTDESIETEVVAPPADELRDIERAAKECTYTQRVGAAFVSFITFYSKLHSGHDVKASSLDVEAREKRADEAVELSVEMQRCFLALIGTHRRRTYAHDFVYGMHQLYKLFAKPWNASTEGSEHAHQEMKKFFHHLVVHSSKAKHGSCYQILRLRIVKKELLDQFASQILPHTEYAAMRSGILLGVPAASASPCSGCDTVQAKKRSHVANLGVKVEKKYKEDTAMRDTAALIQEELVKKS